MDEGWEWCRERLHQHLHAQQREAPAKRARKESAYLGLKAAPAKDLVLRDLRSTQSTRTVLWNGFNDLGACSLSCSGLLGGHVGNISMREQGKKKK